MLNDNKLRYNKHGLIFKILHDRYNMFTYKNLSHQHHAKLIGLHRDNENRQIDEMQADEENEFRC